MVAWNAKKAYEMSGVGPEDINVTQVHDAMTFCVTSSIEAPGYDRTLIIQDYGSLARF
jgi:hypothetical protein